MMKIKIEMILETDLNPLCNKIGTAEIMNEQNNNIALGLNNGKFAYSK